MKKLTVALVLVALLILPMVGLAEGNANPPKPGTSSNPGLGWAAIQGFLMSGVAWGVAAVEALFRNGAPPPWAQNK